MASNRDTIRGTAGAFRAIQHTCARNLSAVAWSMIMASPIWSRASWEASQGSQRFCARLVSPPAAWAATCRVGACLTALQGQACTVRTAPSETRACLDSSCMCACWRVLTWPMHKAETILEERRAARKVLCAGGLSRLTDAQVCRASSHRAKSSWDRWDHTRNQTLIIQCTLSRVGCPSNTVALVLHAPSLHLQPGSNTRSSVPAAGIK